MAFCKYCGKKLEEGQVCSCPEATAAREAKAVSAAASQPAVEAVNPAAEEVKPAVEAVNPAAEEVKPAAEEVNPAAEEAKPVEEAVNPAPAAKPVTITLPTVDKEQVKGQVMGFWKSFVSILKAPATGGAAFLSGENRNSALVFIGVQIFLSAILSCCYIGNINSALSGVGGALLSGLTSKLKFSGLQAFFLTILFAAVAALLFAAIFWLVGLVAKLKFSINHAIEVAGIRAVYNIPVILIAILFAFLEVGISIALFAGATIFVMAFVQGALVEKYPEKKNILIYITIVAIAVFAIAMALIMSKGITLYVPKAIKDSLSGGLSKSLMKGLY
ncbi:MAG: hypothetical protein ACI4FY_07885 [Acetatifactor sp.]